jgi:hypothetical protein
MIDSQRVLSLSFVLVKPSRHYLNLLFAFISHNCQDIFRKYSQSRIAKDWQTMCDIFEEI